MMKPQSRKLLNLTAASLLTLVVALAAAPARADHGGNLVAPVVTILALGALLHHRHHRHHYHGHGYGHGYGRYRHHRHHRRHRYSHSYGYGGYRPHKPHRNHHRRDRDGHKRHAQRSHW